MISTKIITFAYYLYYIKDIMSAYKKSEYMN